MAFNQQAKPIFRYTPAQPVQVRQFDYSKLSADEFIMLHSAALFSCNLTASQRERLINLQRSKRLYLRG